MILNEPKRPLFLGISRDNIIPSQQGLRRKLQVRKVDRECPSPRIALSSSLVLHGKSMEILIYNLAGGFEHLFPYIGNNHPNWLMISNMI